MKKTMGNAMIGLRSGRQNNVALPLIHPGYGADSYREIWREIEKERKTERKSKKYSEKKRER